MESYSKIVKNSGTLKQYFLFDETYNMLSLLGIGVIIGAVLLNIFSANMSRRPPHP